MQRIEYIYELISVPRKNICSGAFSTATEIFNKIWCMVIWFSHLWFSHVWSPRWKSKARYDHQSAVENGTTVLAQKNTCNFHNYKRLGKCKYENGKLTLSHNFNIPHNIKGYNRNEIIKQLWILSDQCIIEDPYMRPTFDQIQEKLRVMSMRNLDQSFTTTCTQ